MNKLKYLIPTLSLLVAMLLLSFQNFQGKEQSKVLPFIKAGDSQWYKMKDDAQLSVSDFLQKHTGDLGMSASDKWVNYRTEEDKLGMTHYRYQLHHKGIPVNGSELLVHVSKDGFVSHFNGTWVKGLSADTDIVLSGEEALTKALEFVPASKYIWEDAGAEALLQQSKRDPSATFYPQPELVLYNKNFPKSGGTFRAAYKMIIHAHSPEIRKMIFVDAQNGSQLGQQEKLYHSNTPATAETFYHGTQEIITDLIDNSHEYRLLDITRGFGIHTRDMNRGTAAGNAVEFLNQSTLWNNINAERDEVATDAHWSAEMTFDFFDQHLGHTGVDGNNMQLISLVHFDNNWFNASWNGSWVSLGDGDGSNATPFTSLDVVGHEFAHGVTNFTANLVYQDESGALNESFSDVFGAAIEHWAEPEFFDYLIGDDFIVNGNLRSMSNPNSAGDPDTYRGSFWKTGTADFGGVHSNSGVQNFWFYLLTEGGSGINDNDDNYSVIGLGIDTSTMIAYRNLKFYLTQNSQYADARQGALQAAEDLYGPCSFPFVQTGNAWGAVGIGEVSDVNDFEMTGIINMDTITCGLTDAEFPSLALLYKGCSTPLEPNTKIALAMQVDNGPITRDTMTLATGLVGGETLEYTFNKPVSGLEAMGFLTLKAWVEFDNDAVENNNSTSLIIENVLDQNTDFENKRIKGLVNDCFMNTQRVEVEVVFQGCESIPAGEEIFFSFARVGGDVVTESRILTEPLQRGESLFYGFSNTLKMKNRFGQNDIDAWVDFPPDFISVNDSTTVNIVNPRNMKYNDIVTFEADDLSRDSFYTFTTAYSDAFLSEKAEADIDGISGGKFGMLMTGGNVQEALDNNLLDLPESVNQVWNRNEAVSAKMCVCVNATAMTAIELSFDLKQTYSFFFNNDAKLASTMRVLVDDEQISPTYSPNTHLFDPWEHHVLDLSDFAGNKLEVCFETRNFYKNAVGDNAYIDNVQISGVVGTDDITNNVNTLTVSPNPGNGEFVVHYTNKVAQLVQLEVFDVHGRKLWSKAGDGLAGENYLALDLNHFAEGVYFLRLDDGVGVVSRSLVVVK